MSGTTPEPPLGRWALFALCCAAAVEAAGIAVLIVYKLW